MTTGTPPWWQRTVPGLYRWVGEADDDVRARHAALLEALDRMSIRAVNATPTEIATALADIGYPEARTAADLRADLDVMETWGLVERFHDPTAAIQTVRDAERRAERWTLTRAGRAVVRGVRDTVADLEKVLAIPERLLDGVIATLDATIRAAKADDPDIERHLADVASRTEEIRDAMTSYYLAIGDLSQRDVTDTELFTASRDRVIAILDQVHSRYRVKLPVVTDRLAQLAVIGHRRIAEAAFRRAGVLREEDAAAYVAVRVDQLDAIAEWFLPGGPMEEVVGGAVSAVRTILGAIHQRTTAVRRGSDLATDFLALARATHRQADDHTARQVFCAATGWWPARHAQTSLTVSDERGVPALVGLGRERVEVIIRSHEREGPLLGRPTKIRRPTAAREAAAAAAQAAAARDRRAALRLCTDAWVRLDHFAGLGSAEAGHLLALVSTAMTEAAHGRPPRAVSEELGLVCVCRPPDRDDPPVSVTLAEGTLAGPDVLVWVVAAADADTLPDSDVTVEAVVR